MNGFIVDTEEAGLKAERPGASLRDRVRSAAFACFSTRGFAGTSMLEIATGAQISKRDLYAQYPNKHAILADCIRDKAAAMRRPLAEVALPQSRADLVALLAAIGASIMRGVCTLGVLTVYRLAIAEAVHVPELARALDTEGREANHRLFCELLARAQEAGLMGAGDPAVLTGRFFAMLWGDLLVRLLMGVREMPGDAEIEARARAAAEGLPIIARTEAGRLTLR
ncbi:MAG TPA: TetR/AcrR family transcriptional regulator [Stellaceae bacterium]|nr:TetR/AcrR family transcriptional regulator [Stellaceae bacterium]